MAWCAHTQARPRHSCYCQLLGETLKDTLRMPVHHAQQLWHATLNHHRAILHPSQMQCECRVCHCWPNVCCFTSDGVLDSTRFVSCMDVVAIRSPVPTESDLSFTRLCSNTLFGCIHRGSVCFATVTTVFKVVSQYHDASTQVWTPEAFEELMHEFTTCALKTTQPKEFA